MLPFGSAQDKKPPQLPSGQSSSVGSDKEPDGRQCRDRRPARLLAWEYKYVIRTSNRLDDFEKALSSNATSGWEYVGTETLQVTDSNKKD